MTHSKIRILYIRIAKTGSTSISSILPDDAIEIGVSRKHRKVFERYRKDITLKFTIVRNPYDRFVSAYKMLTTSKAAKSRYLAIGDRMAKMSFSKFAAEVLRLRESFTDYEIEKVKGMHFLKKRRFPARLVRRHDPISRDIHWILSHTESMVDTIRFYLPVEELDFIGRFENLANDYMRIQELLSVYKTLPRLNTSEGRRDYRDYYDEETRRLVTSMYREDLELFDYRF